MRIANIQREEATAWQKTLLKGWYLVKSERKDQELAMDR